MYRNLRSALGTALCLLGLVAPLAIAAEQPSKPLPAAQAYQQVRATTTQNVQLERELAYTREEFAAKEVAAQEAAARASAKRRARAR